MNRRTLVILAIVLLAIGIAGRLLPHSPNTTPITALIFATTLYFGRSLSIFLPFGVLLVTDLIFGFYEPWIMVSVYGSFLIIILLSWWSRKHSSVLRIGFSVLGSSIIFFLTTNSAVWWFSSWYEKDIVGLLYCFELALPFLRNMLLGDIIYTPLLLGGISLVSCYSWDITKLFIHKKHKLSLGTQ